ncbi:phosphopantetheine-binding protein [Parabacteroides sp.]|uniref:phosphopantetheine-binding protein n=1 Tax=Parabacteroides sp. TaxID=1869337 RepID=UPI0025795B4D|nr:phosphopantetheine-binding protein [Parabacteroides sp.]
MEHINIKYEMKDFIKNFANQFDDTELSEFQPEIKFRDLEEWSSLTGLAVMNMVEKKYGVKLTVLDLRSANTIEELYNVVTSK